MAITEIAELKQQIEDLQDQFKNAIKYDKKGNYYYLVWTDKQIKDAEKYADELMDKLKLHDCGI